MEKEELIAWYQVEHKDVIGRTIVDVRPLTDLEEEVVFYGEGWGAHAYVLDNDMVIIPSRDEEGNGPGASFIYTLPILRDEDDY
jgi:hypothetical protein